MKHSKQRELIKKVIIESRTHPTADEIYCKLKPQNPSLSLGTVYRNLSVLVDSGDIAKINIESGINRYDAVAKEHCHVICSQCGSVFDVDIVLPNQVLDEVVSKTGVYVTSHQLIFKGVCNACKSSGN